MGLYNKSNEIESVRTHLITLYANAENIYRIQCGYFFRGFFDFMTKDRSF